MQSRQNTCPHLQPRHAVSVDGEQNGSVSDKRGNRTYFGLERVIRDGPAHPAKIHHFLIMSVALHSLELSDHVKLSTESIIMFGWSGDSSPHFSNSELLLAPTADLVDERRGGLDVGELFDEPHDIFSLEVLLHHTFE